MCYSFYEAIGRNLLSLLQREDMIYGMGGRIRTYHIYAYIRYICVCVYIYIYINTQTHTNTHMYIYMYIYIYTYRFSTFDLAGISRHSGIFCWLLSLANWSFRQWWCSAWALVGLGWGGTPGKRRYILKSGLDSGFV